MNDWLGFDDLIRLPWSRLPRPFPNPIIPPVYSSSLLARSSARLSARFPITLLFDSLISIIIGVNSLDDRL